MCRGSPGRVGFVEACRLGRHPVNTDMDAGQIRLVGLEVDRGGDGVRAEGHERSSTGSVPAAGQR